MTESMFDTTWTNKKTVKFFKYVQKARSFTNGENGRNIFYLQESWSSIEATK